MGEGVEHLTAIIRKREDSAEVNLGQIVKDRVVHRLVAAGVGQRPACTLALLPDSNVGVGAVGDAGVDLLNMRL